MAKTEFKFSARKDVTKTDAVKTAQENDAKNTNFSLDAETGEELTLTGTFKEGTWERFENGEKKGEGVSLFAVAEKKDGSKIDIPFGLFKSVNRLASGGVVIECKAHFGKNTSQENILNFCLSKTKIKVFRYLFFREGQNYETEITKVL